MLTSTSNSPENKTNSIQVLARPALAFGVLSSAAEAQIDSLVAKGGLSSQDCLLVAVLKDAIKEGRVRLNRAASYSQFQY
jgi:hypothetical protein